MKVVFFSNFLNHHQLPLCMEFIRQKGIDFVFVATEQIPKERLDMNYLDMNMMYEFVIRSYESNEAEKESYDLAVNADVAIFGSAPISYLERRMNAGKITFRFCERSLKKGYYRRFNPFTFWKIYKEYLQYRKMPLYVLGASAYTANDLKLCGFNINKCYTWGYFPETRHYDNINFLMKQKDKNSILWVARLIDLKHPEFAIKIAKKLKKENISFSLKLIGDGMMKKQLQDMIKQEQLSEFVELTGSLNTEIVREKMEKSGIFLFTSDFHEGWGAVVNEAMNSGCAVVTSHACGAAPFLIEQNRNGIVYEVGDFEEAYQNVKKLLKDSAFQEELGRNAYFSICEKWNAHEAVVRFLKLVDELMKVGHCELYQDGPCSLSGLFKNKWYRAKKKE